MTAPRLSPPVAVGRAPAQPATTLQLVERPPLDARAVAAMLGCTEAEGALALGAFRQLARVAVAQALRSTSCPHPR